MSSRFSIFVAVQRWAMKSWHRAAPEGLHRGQLADDSVAGHHLSGAERQAQGDDCGQTLGEGGVRQREVREKSKERDGKGACLRDGGHTERHSNLKVVDTAL